MSLTQEIRIKEIGEWLGSDSLNFFGKPFAGKDTQAAALALPLGVSVVGGGDILRNSVIPPDVKLSMDRGELIPSVDYQNIVLPFLSQEAFIGKPLLLSAVGRVAGEEQGVLAATSAAGHPIKAVPYLDITEAESYRRLSTAKSRGRADDTPEKLKVRLEEFLVKTEPVLAHYDDMGLLIPVDAMGEENIVFASLVNSLYERACAS